MGALTGCSPTPQQQRAVEQEELGEVFQPSFASASADYEAAMRSVRTAGQQALAANDQAGVIAVYRTLRDASREAAAAFDGITAPAAVRQRQEALVANLRQQAETLDQVVAAAESGDDADLTSGLTRLASLLADFTTIHAAIDQELAQGP